MNVGKYAGSVVKRPFATGSKSQRDAILLVTGDREYVLRRPGANAFHDPDLEQFVGKRVRCTGTLTGYTLLVTDCAAV